jgi:hypothetical protein
VGVGVSGVPGGGVGSGVLVARQASVGVAAGGCCHRPLDNAAGR